MKKILIAIANYGLKNREYLHTLLDSYNSMVGYDITVMLFITDAIDKTPWPNLRFQIAMCDKALGEALTHAHKNFFVDWLNNYDYFLYSEDDMLIKQSHIDLAVEYQEKLPMPYVIGFLRYELKPGSDYKYMFDNHPVHSVHRGGRDVIKSNYQIDGENYFEVYNIHQGCYFIPRAALDIAIKSGRYLENSPNYANGVLEGAASNIYWKCGLTKVIPRNRVSELVIAHLPNRYVNWRTDVYNEQSTLSDVTIAQHQKDMTPLVL